MRKVPKRQVKGSYKGPGEQHEVKWCHQAGRLGDPGDPTSWCLYPSSRDDATQCSAGDPFT